MFYVVQDTEEIFRERCHIYNHSLQVTNTLALHSNHPSLPMLLAHVQSSCLACPRAFVRTASSTQTPLF